MQGFVNGINLGGWLSQYREFDHEHFRTFITEEDIARIASWGMDHVRLPVDYPVLESDDAIGVPLDVGYGYVDSCLSWCQKHGLGVVLDIHEAPGFTFTNALEEETKDKNTLFDNVAVQDRFIALWETIVRRYADSPVPIIFELLNEVTIPHNGPWNTLIERTVPALRAISPSCTIMIGGTHNNGVSGLEDLIVLDDPNVIYTFHFYDPLLFTHQNAYWSAPPREWGGSPAYPGFLDGLGEFLETAPQHAADHAQFVGVRMDRELLVTLLEPALEFQRVTGHELYCGEFGVAEWIDPESRQNWMADIFGILREHNIGRALWSYKQMDFGVVDAEGNVVDPGVLGIISGAS